MFSIVLYYVNVALVFWGGFVIVSTYFVIIEFSILSVGTLPLNNDYGSLKKTKIIIWNITSNKLI